MITIMPAKNSSMGYYYDIISMEDKPGHYYIKPKYNLGIKYLVLNGVPIKADNPIMDIDSYGNTIKVYLYELDQENFMTIDNVNMPQDMSIIMDVCYMTSVSEVCVLKVDVKGE